uniref:Uncharacterized protein n=1 Tax=Octopus bimaculoides TaxID=37653 RepID=A0A0L8H475_OCTBM
MYVCIEVYSQKKSKYNPLYILVYIMERMYIIKEWYYYQCTKVPKTTIKNLYM